MYSYYDGSFHVQLPWFDRKGGGLESESLFVLADTRTQVCLAAFKNAVLVS